MLNKPKFMKPSMNKEECTIDVNANEIYFSCIVDGNESVKYWRIIIYKIENNEKVYDTGDVELTSPFYPIDEKNRNVVFVKNLKSYPSIIPDSFKNRAEAYYWTITLTGGSGYVATSYQEVFYANKIPEINLSYIYQVGEADEYPVLNNNAVLTSKGCTFKATYQQENGVQVKRYGWRIIDADSGQVFVDTITSNQIYGSADNIICSYDGFLNGANYSVELFIETQNNTKVTHKRDFSVSYESTFLSSDFKVETLENEPAIMLDWNKSIVISGVLLDADNNIVNIQDTIFKKDYPVTSRGSIEIPDKFKVVYGDSSGSKFDISEDSYIAISTQLLVKDETTLFFAEGYDDKNNGLIRKLSYNNEDGLRYEVMGREGIVRFTTYKVESTPSEYVWYNIFMSPLIKNEYGEDIVELKVFEGNVIDCIYPRKDINDPTKDLYPINNEEDPTKNFYPIFGRWSNIKEV